MSLEKVEKFKYYWLRSKFYINEHYSFVTPFNTKVYIKIQDGMYIIESEDEKVVPDSKIEPIWQTMKPSELVYVLRQSNLEPEEQYYVFKKLTFEVFTVPLLDPYVQNLNIHHKECMITHSLGIDIKYGVKYRPDEVSKLIDALCARELGKIPTTKTPIIEGSIQFLDYILRISVTGGEFGIAPMNQVSIRKHKRSFYTIIDQINTKFINTTLGAILAANYAFSTSLSHVVCGIMGTRKTSLLASLIEFVEPNCIIGIIQEDPEVNIVELPYTYVEWHCARKGITIAQEFEITLLDLLKAALRKNYRKVIIAEVRGPEEIYYFIQALKQLHGVGTTIHAYSPETVKRRLLNAFYRDLRVDVTDLEPIKLLVVCTLTPIGPKVKEIYLTNFIHDQYKILVELQENDWIINDDVFDEYIQCIAELNNLSIKETKEFINEMEKFLDLMTNFSKLRKIDYRLLREYIVKFYLHGLDYVIEELKSTL